MSALRIIFIADIFGEPGRRAVYELLPGLVEKHRPDLCVANGENVAGGFGCTAPLAESLFHGGIDLLTGGNHSWDRRESIEWLDREERVLRPANYPEGTPGRGAGIFTAGDGTKVGVINLIGRVFLSTVECPFRAADRWIEELRRETPILIVDMHAEATSEKIALGHHVDGRASAVIGTHTHVQTADEKILPGGTAYITDAGMTGPHDSVIGVRKDRILKRFLTNMPVRFEPASDGILLCGLVVDVDRETGRAVRIERIQEPLD